MLIIPIEVHPNGNNTKKYVIGRLKIISTLEVHPGTEEYRYKGIYERY